MFGKPSQPARHRVGRDEAAPEERQQRERHRRVVGGLDVAGDQAEELPRVASSAFTAHATCVAWRDVSRRVIIRARHTSGVVPRRGAISARSANASKRS